MPPRVESFSLDLNTDILRLVLDEPIDVENIDYSSIILTTPTLIPMHALTGANGTSIDVGERVIVDITLSPQDVIAIKSDLSLAVDAENTVVIVSPGAIRDFATTIYWPRLI